MLDLGCGAGRHAFEALRRGARVVALDTDAAELAQVSAMFTAMHETGEVPPPRPAPWWPATRRRCRSPTADSTG